MFTENQIDILKAARFRIENELDRFICCAINSVVQVNCTEDRYYAEAVGLKEQIEFGLDQRSCLELWLFGEVGIYPEDLTEEAKESWSNHYLYVGWKTPLKREVFNEVLKNARLAWIDRALENGNLH